LKAEWTSPGFFNLKERWIAETGGYTIGVFVSQINKLVSTSAAANRNRSANE
jgi:hypothetical protein